MQLSLNEQIDRLVCMIEDGVGYKIRPFIVAIDGRSGTGKSTLAGTLAQRLQAEILSGDDFFAGGEHILDETPQTLAEICIDWQEQREVLERLHLSKDAQFCPYDWDAFDGSKNAIPRIVRARPIVIFEGVYSARPELRDLVDLHVLLDVPDKVRRIRLLKREGEISEREQQWHRAEDWYFRSSATHETFDVVVSDNAQFPP